MSYMGTSLIRNRLPLGPYSRPLPRALWWSRGGGHFRARYLCTLEGRAGVREYTGHLDHKQTLPPRTLHCTVGISKAHQYTVVLGERVAV